MFENTRARSTRQNCAEETAQYIYIKSFKIYSNMSELNEKLYFESEKKLLRRNYYYYCKTEKKYKLTTVG